jgi:hydroxypyruvate isomerase
LIPETIFQMQKINRRNTIKNLLAGSAAIVTGSSFSTVCNQQSFEVKLKGNINHSVCKWTYDFLAFEELCKTVKQIGFSAIDLCTPSEWPTLKKYNIHCSMCYHDGAVSLTEGFNNPIYHAQLIRDYSAAIPLVAAAGYQNIICFSGNRNGMNDEEGMQHCITGLKQILSIAEKYGVIVQMEVFNSKVDHPDYMADNTKWSFELVRKLGSPNFKILYDIYHMQIDEGDIIRTIADGHEYIGHYHTAGVPGRNEIDESQELNYPAIMRAILKTGYTGYVAQEFIPVASDKIASLKQAIEICDV